MKSTAPIGMIEGESDDWARPLAYRAYYDDAGGKLSDWGPSVRWWSMSTRLFAEEVLGTTDLTVRWLPDCMEWRRK